jgi:hypothetical protein
MMAHPPPVFIHCAITEVLHEREEELRRKLDAGEISEDSYKARRMPHDVFKVIDNGFHRAFDLFDKENSNDQT